MPLPRKKDAGSSGAPVLNLLSARVMLTDVEEYTEPRTVTRKADGRSFTFDPAFNCTVEIVDDGADGSNDGVKFFESFKYKQDKDGKWFNQANSKLGALTEVVKPGYFDDDTIPELDASDLEGFEMLCRVKPKKNPSTGAVTGSTIDWETMQPLPNKAKAAAATAAVEVEEDKDFGDIPF
ncbi:MAG: hypothetical protein CYG60_20125 [Actinobacteria bacterium]|nr:MAG: hypothetical protein CYG60_20125 [Actinomycetota bacterium]